MQNIPSFMQSGNDQTPKNKVIILSTGEKLVQQNGKLRDFREGDVIGSMIETNPNVQLSYYYLA